MRDFNKLQRRIGDILVTRVHVEVPSLTTDLMNDGLLDSITLVELIVGIEEEFGIQIRVEDIDIEHFRSIERIAEFVAACVARDSAHECPDSAPSFETLENAR